MPIEPIPTVANDLKPVDPPERHCLQDYDTTYQSFHFGLTTELVISSTPVDTRGRANAGSTWELPQAGFAASTA